MSIRLDGQVAIVTGAGQGLGRCHALALAQRGARIMVTYLDDDGNATKTEPFADGWLNEDGYYLGRPVDVQQYVDGSILVSDDKAGAIYRISYTGN